MAVYLAGYQAVLLRRQIQLQAILDLDKEWRSAEMQQVRSSSWTEEGHPDEDEIEGVLEFLEKVSSLEERGVIQYRLVWDTLGWYLVRYHHYCRNVIEILRQRWTHERDATLYQDLERLSGKLLKEEAAKRGTSETKVIKELDDERLRKQFIEFERSGGQ